MPKKCYNAESFIVNSLLLLKNMVKRLGNLTLTLSLSACGIWDSIPYFYLSLVFNFTSERGDDEMKLKFWEINLMTTAHFIEISRHSGRHLQQAK